jgi:hypothetical protein
MADPNEIAALKASFRGAMRTAAALGTLSATVEGLDPTAELTTENLETLARVSAAHAIASNPCGGCSSRC